MLDRREFLIGGAGAVTAPAFAALRSPLEASVSPLSLPAPASTLAQASPPGQPVLRIDGWEPPGESAHAVDGEVWVHINSSGRAAWR